ncbi:hypothetical protein CLI92_02385 [Vandammella animalimorsus]|uniref:MFS transporter n=1 Tax=Vandammella animalimorsus TaxID=2029117 RepID=A0A2A2T9E2_9BURK|nr:MFS transporter [Vandammella animalimorsus]PAT31736.1 hypothetical protein CK626_08815 [Vandammella animalimorsus]PAX18660.1 hypothetical protein CLI92_02385 [Vandammella animalimorsus]PAX20823.1 hypothetical protein CLI93_03810 [Vandammella animalimorsus]
MTSEEERGPAALAAVRASEYRALALMYITQGLPAGLAFYALGTLIRAGGYSVAHVGLVGLTILPWALKFLWASWIDNACIRWRYPRVIFIGQTAAALTCLALMPLSIGAHLGLALAGLVALNFISATQDIATNAYAVSRLQGKAAGVANAIQIAGFIVGMLLGGGGLLIVHDHLGWSATMAILAGLIALIGVLLWLDKRWQAPLASAESSGRSCVDSSAGAAAKVRLRDLLRHRDLGWALALVLLFKFPSTAVSTLIQPWLVDRGLGLDAIGYIQMAVMLATACGGVVLGIPLVQRLGNRRAVLASFAMAALMLGMAWGLEWCGVHAQWAYYLAFCTQGVFEGALFVSVWAVFMNWSSPHSPGTDFTAMQCGENIANAMAIGAIGGLGQMLGYANAFALVWGAAGLVLVLIALCLPRLVLQTEGRA